MRQQLSGDSVHSRASRTDARRAWLEVEGGQAADLPAARLHVLGTATKFVDRVRVRDRFAAGGATRIVLLDSGHVSGFDSTARSSFDRLQQYAGERGIEPALCGMQQALAGQWRAGAATLHTDLDRAIEWCEQRILDEAGLGNDRVPSMREQLAALVPDAACIDALLARRERREVRAGTVLLRQGGTGRGVRSRVGPVHRTVAARQRSRPGAPEDHAAAHHPR